MENKRDHERVPQTGRVHAFDPATGVQVVENARIWNVGKNGFALASEERLIRGNLYEFRLQFPTDSLYLTGRVVHLKNERVYFVIGVKIESMGFFQRTRHNRILAAKSEKTRTTFLVYSATGAVLVFLFLKFFLGLPLMAGLLGGAAAFAVLFALLPF